VADTNFEKIQLVKLMCRRG